MIIDTFMYRGEADLLEMRLNELNGKVDHHVLVEATRTHRGDLKPLFYEQQKLRFRAWQDKITTIVADNLPEQAREGMSLSWTREHAQRDAAIPFLEDFTVADDIILISDLDEFPSDTALAWDGAWPGAVALLQRTFHSAIDWEYPARQYTSVLARAGIALSQGLAATRDGRYTYPVIRDGGWHFSWLGGTQALQEKLAMTCHEEIGKEEYDDLKSGASWKSGQHHAPDAEVKAVDVDETWPRWIYERKCPAEWFRPR